MKSFIFSQRQLREKNSDLEAKLKLLTEQADEQEKISESLFRVRFLEEKKFSYGLSKENDKLKSEIDNLQSKNEYLFLRNSNLKNLIKDLEAENQNLTSTNIELESNLHRQQLEFEEEKKLIEHYQTLYNQLKIETKAILLKNIELRNHLD